MTIERFGELIGQYKQQHPEFPWLSIDIWNLPQHDSAAFEFGNRYDGGESLEILFEGQLSDLANWLEQQTKGEQQ
jgi:hypothetical protein